VPVAAEEPHSGAGLVELQAPAVELDFMRPARAAGRRGPEGGLAWRDEAGEGGHGAALCRPARTAGQRARGHGRRELENAVNGNMFFWRRKQQ
jgi:hypothetical protein